MRKRDCVVKRLWEWGTPYIQGGGWLILMMTIAYSGVVLVEKAQAFDERITQNTEAIERLSNVDEKLDLVIKLLKK